MSSGGAVATAQKPSNRRSGLPRMARRAPDPSGTEPIRVHASRRCAARRRAASTARFPSVHPIERLRYVARSHGGDQRLLVRETAGALRGLGLDPAGLVVACRRIVERHPTSGPLWWLCSSVVAAPAPFEVAARLADRIEDDPTPEVLIDALPADATITLLGWPDLAGEAVLRRGDAIVLAVDIADEGGAFVRRLQRNDVEAEIVEPAGLAAAVLSSDVVLIEALACS